MGLLDDCQKFFGSRDLYEVLGVEKNSSEAELKKAYRKASLIIHPDKVPVEYKEEATHKFQTLAKVYYLLSDKEKRDTYDETGSIDEETVFGDEKDWSSYWRFLFPKITMKDINDFMGKYKGSDEEKEDLKKLYVRYEGDLDQISECLIGYAIEDEKRYCTMLKDLIQAKEIPKFDKFVKESATKKNNRKKRFAKEAVEAAHMRKEMKVDEADESLLNALANRSQQRESAFNDLIKNLESKYCDAPKGKKKRGKK